MGGTVSRGIDNQSLIDELIRSGPDLSPEIERVLRLVDRGNYFEKKSARAYMDLAWRSGSLHLSAPSIYIVALQNLDIQPGLRFLNVGSGSGYLSTIIGLLLGYSGVNHGIEVNEFNVTFAKDRLASFLAESDAPFERSFCVPSFILGNIFNLLNSDDHESANLLVLPLPFEQRLVTTTSSNSLAFESNNSHINEDPEIATASSTELRDFSTAFENQGNQEIEQADLTKSEVSTGEILRDEGEANENNDDDDEISHTDNYNPVHWGDNLLIGPPPTLKVDSSLNQNEKHTLRWPLYDRIYVGAAIMSRAHLQSILRLLNVGGLMVAPVRDKFLKIKRVSENKVSIFELMTVSFSTLIVPSANTYGEIELPPICEVAKLERLCADFIRSRLRTLIKYRHNGLLPILGHLEELKKLKGDGPVSATTNNKDALKKERMLINRCGDNSGSNYNPEPIEQLPVDGSVNGSDSVERPRTRTSPMARFLHYLLTGCDMNQGRSNAPCGDEANSNRTPQSNITTDQNSRNSNLPSSNPESHDSHTPNLTFRIRGFIVPNEATARNPVHADNQYLDPTNTEIHVHYPDESSTTEDDEDAQEEQANSTRKRKSDNNGKESNYRWIPPSYTFKDEMRKILTDEIYLPSLSTRSVMGL